MPKLVSIDDQRYAALTLQSLRVTIGPLQASTTSLESQESYLTAGMLPYNRNVTLQTFLSSTRDFYRLHSTFARLYNAAASPASPASRLRSAGSLAIIRIYLASLCPWGRLVLCNRGKLNLSFLAVRWAFQLVLSSIILTHNKYHLRRRHKRGSSGNRVAKENARKKDVEQHLVAIKPSLISLLAEVSHNEANWNGVSFCLVVRDLCW